MLLILSGRVRPRKSKMEDVECGIADEDQVWDEAIHITYSRLTLKIRET